MHKLEQSLRQWGKADFEATLKQEIRHLPAGTLPLQRATSQGGMIDESRLALSVLACEQQPTALEIRVMVMFDEIVGGCSCHDDPVSTQQQCVMIVRIDKQTAVAEFTITEQ